MKSLSLVSASISNLLDVHARAHVLLIRVNIQQVICDRNNLSLKEILLFLGIKDLKRAVRSLN